jgi:hypothetical protein
VRRERSSLTLALVMLLPWASLASAGPRQPVAVVSTLSGDVTVARTGGSTPLKFKDETFGNDIISTADQSIVRLLVRDKALMAVQQRSVVTLREEQGNLTVELGTGRLGLSVVGRRLGAEESLQIGTPNVRASIHGGNVIVKTGKIANGAQTTLYVVDGSVEVFLRSAATRRSVKVEGPRQLTVVGKTFGDVRALSGVDSAKLLAELRAKSHQHVNAPAEIQRVIERSGRVEAIRQAKLVAKQVKQAGGQRQPEGDRTRSLQDTRMEFATGQGTGSESGSPTEPSPTPTPGAGGAEGGSSGNKFSVPLNKVVSEAGGGNPIHKDPSARTSAAKPVTSPTVMPPVTHRQTFTPQLPAQKIAPKATP